MAPDLADDPGDDVAQVGVPDEGDPCELQLAVALNVDMVRPVDHDLGDRRVSHQAFDRAVPEDLVGDDLAHLCGLLDRHGGPLAPERRLHDSLDPGPQFLRVDDRVVEDRPQLGYHPPVDPLTHRLQYLSPGVGYANLVTQPCVQARARGLPSRASARRL